MAGISTRTTRLLGAVLAGALITLLAPAAASADLDFKRCPDSRSRCATLRVPLDRSGALARRGAAEDRAARLGRRPPDARLPLRRPGRRGHRGDALRAPARPAARDALPRRRLRPARHGRLRPAALPGARARPAAAQRRRRGRTARSRLGAARTHYTTPDSVEDLEAIRAGLGVDKLTLFGISYGTELALAYARAHPDHVERLILDSVVDPDDRDPFGLAGFRAMAPDAARAVPGRLPRRERRSGRRPGGAGRPPAARSRCAASSFDRRGPRAQAHDRRRPRSPTCSTTRTTTRRCAPASRPPCKAALAGDAAPLARLVAEGDGLADLPAPRSFSSARYATVCEETPLPWDAATPVADRMAEARRRADGARPGGVRAVRLRHRGRGRDRPLPALARRALGRDPGAGRRRIPRCRR